MDKVRIASGVFPSSIKINPPSIKNASLPNIFDIIYIDFDINDIDANSKRQVAAEGESNEDSCYRCNGHGRRRGSQGASSAGSGCAGFDAQAAQARYVSWHGRD